MAKCNFDCFHCIFDECINSGRATKTERMELIERDNVYHNPYGSVKNARPSKGRRMGNRH